VGVVESDPVEAILYVRVIAGTKGDHGGAVLVDLRSDKSSSDIADMCGVLPILRAA
jgi:hypothetical protein